MDNALQINGPEKVFCVPHGLRELSSDIVREVLRFQPENIYCFIADYLDTMLEVREKVRESAQVIEDIYMQCYFLNNLYKTKGIGKEEADAYATTIQAHWRGFTVRKKLSEYLKKKERFQEERERKRSQKIEEILSSLGITLDEEGKPKPGKWVVNEDGQECWVQDIPIEQRRKEEERAFGRFDRWEREEYEDYFEIDDVTGEILYKWPKLGQLRKIPREEIPPGVEIVQFFGMRDLQGKEQYSYLIEPQHGEQKHGIPVGFLIPMEGEDINMAETEVIFAKIKNEINKGDHMYAFREEPDRTDLIKFFKTPESQTSLNNDQKCLLPRVVVKIRKENLWKGDEEVHFLKEENNVINKNELHTFKAENLKQTAKIIKYILQNPEITIREAMEDLKNKAPYKTRCVGRFIPVENFERPKHIQKIMITPESHTGKAELDDLDQHEYIFLPKGFKPSKPMSKGEPVLKIPIVRFQGYHTEYQGSDGLGQEKIFIMGPTLPSSDGKPFTYESLFWDDYGEQAWYQYLHNIQDKEISDEDEELFDINSVEKTEVIKEADSVKQIHLVKSEKSKSKISSTTTKRSTPHEIEALPTLKEEIKEPEPVEANQLTQPTEMSNEKKPLEVTPQAPLEEVHQEEEEKLTSEVTDKEEDMSNTEEESGYI